MTLVVDHSGRLLSPSKPTIRDVTTNAEAGVDENRCIYIIASMIMVTMV